MCLAKISINTYATSGLGRCQFIVRHQNGRNVFLNEHERKLLMCAANIPADRQRPQSEPSVDRTRHIPVPVAPTQPTSVSGPGSASPRGPQSSSGSGAKNPHLKLALAGERQSASAASAASATSSSTDSQPLNLSTRTPPPADVPAEA